MQPRHNTGLQQSPTGRDQRGVALLVSLVLIFVMSVLGLSAMRASTLEGRMASNAFEKDLTFQAAESATDFVINDDTQLEAVICADPVSQSLTNLNANSTLDTSVDLTYGGESVAFGFSLDSGFTALRFTVVGTAQISGGSTRSRVAQGVYILGAKSGTGGCS